MSVNEPIRVAGPFVGDGVLVELDFDFETFAISDISVVVTNADGVETLLTLDTGYTVALNSGSAGGAVTLLTALATGTTAHVYGDAMAYTRTGNIISNPGGFFPAIVNSALDRIHIALLQLASLADRGVKVPRGEASVLLPSIDDRAGKVFGFNAGGGPVAVAIDDSLDGSLRADLADDDPAKGAALVGFLQTGTGAVARTAQAKARDVVSVKDFGAVGDGVTNDRTAIQAAFDSGAKRVMFPSGVYIVTGGGLTVPNWLAVIGEGYGPTSVPGDSGVLIKFSLTSGIALDCGFNPTFDNIYFTNIGGSYDEGTATLSGTTASGIDLTDNVTMNYCSFAGWETCVMFGPSTFYVKTFGVEFNRCTNGYRTNGAAPYNIDIYAPISRLTTNFFAGQSVYPARNIKVHGGSIEGYSKVAFGFLDISIFGTYFETVSQRAGAIALAPEVNGSAITLVGCLIYMNYTARFANMTGLASAMLTSVGNQYDGAAPAGAICLYMPTSGSVNLSGDRFGTGHPNDAIYVDSIPAAAQFNGITFPVLPSGNSQAAYSGMALIGSRGFISFGLAAAPTDKTTGMTVMADGDSWDPLTRAAGRPYWTIWQGDRWYGLSGEA